MTKREYSVEVNRRHAEWPAQAGTALLLRFAVIVAGCRIFHLSLERFTTARDATSYMAQARAMTGDYSRLVEFDRRVFPGYPALIALTHSILHIPFGIAGLLLNGFSVALSAVLAAYLFRDRRVGWAMAVLTPAYLLYSAIPDSEATLLVFTLAGLLLALDRNRPWVGGILLGIACCIRPPAIFAALGGILALMDRQNRASGARFVAGLVLTGLCAFVSYHAWSGNALLSLNLYKGAYSGRIFDWPFSSLLLTPWRYPVPLWKTMYTWFLAGVTILGCCAVWFEFQTQDSNSKALGRLAGVWLWANTLFVLCIGHIWGFHEFHRFMIPALPPLLWVLRRYLPDRVRIWAGIGFLSFILATFGMRIQ